MPTQVQLSKEVAQRSHVSVWVTIRHNATPHLVIWRCGYYDYYYYQLPILPPVGIIGYLCCKPPSND